MGELALQGDQPGLQFAHLERFERDHEEASDRPAPFVAVRLSASLVDYLLEHDLDAGDVTERRRPPELTEFGRSKVVKLSTALQVDPSELWYSYREAVQMALHESSADVRSVL
jgi:hypothetical protein